MKIGIYTLSILASSFIYGQGVGINTTNPAANTVLHVDGAKDNGTANVGSVSADEAKNDVVVTKTGQVGVGILSPDASAALDMGTNGTFLPPKVANPLASISNPQTGLMIYNTTEACIQVNVGTPGSPSWSCVSAPPPNVNIVTNKVAFSRNDNTNLGAAKRGIIDFVDRNLRFSHRNDATSNVREGNLDARTINPGTSDNFVTIHGWQNATSNNKEGGGTFVNSLDNSYRGDDWMYRGGASGGEFINYTVVSPSGKAYRIFLTLMTNDNNNYQPASGKGRYLMVAEKLN